MACQGHTAHKQQNCVSGWSEFRASPNLLCHSPPKLQRDSPGTAIRLLQEDHRHFEDRPHSTALESPTVLGREAAS